MGGVVSFCQCPCHTSATVLPTHPPPVTDPVESLVCCDLCEPLHRGVWTVWKRPRIIRRWVDKDRDDQADGKR